MRYLRQTVLSALALGAFILVAHAEVIPVPMPTDASTSKPTMTMYWEGKDSKALVIVITGGQGSVGLNPNSKGQIFFNCPPRYAK